MPRQHTRYAPEETHQLGPAVVPRGTRATRLSKKYPSVDVESVIDLVIRESRIVEPTPVAANACALLIAGLLSIGVALILRYGG